MDHGRSSLRQVFEDVSVESLVTAALPAEVLSRTTDEEDWLPH